MGPDRGERCKHTRERVCFCSSGARRKVILVDEKEG